MEGCKKWGGFWIWIFKVGEGVYDLYHPLKFHVPKYQVKLLRNQKWKERVANGGLEAELKGGQSPPKWWVSFQYTIVLYYIEEYCRRILKCPAFLLAFLLSFLYYNSLYNQSFPEKNIFIFILLILVFKGWFLCCFYLHARLEYLSDSFFGGQTLEVCGGALTAYSWQDLSPWPADMAKKLARPFTQSQISMYLWPCN